MLCREGKAGSLLWVVQMQTVLQQEVQKINPISPGAENNVSLDTLINTMILKGALD